MQIVLGRSCEANFFAFLSHSRASAPTSQYLYRQFASPVTRAAAELRGAAGRPEEQQRGTMQVATHNGVKVYNLSAGEPLARDYCTAVLDACNGALLHVVRNPLTIGDV